MPPNARQHAADARAAAHASAPGIAPIAAGTAAAPDAALAAHVLQGLSARQKHLSSLYFYDDEGSRLFQRIMALPEYYLTRLEHEILAQQGDALARWIAPDLQGANRRAIDLIELGSGDGEKTLTLCRALQARGADLVFRPMDVAPLALAELSRRFAAQLPMLPVEPLCGDYFQAWPPVAPQRQQTVLLLGSNLGNLDYAQSVALLQRIRSQLQVGDSLLLGLDLMKDPQVIHAAYSDRQGITAAFNLNLLHRLNRELGMDFAVDQFKHYASYSPLDGAARSFLVSQRRQRVRSTHLACDFNFQAGETIYTEQSQKYSYAMIESLARDSGFAVQHHFSDERGWYTVVAWRAIAAAPIAAPR